jgi:oligogalacturonide lyase
MRPQWPRGGSTRRGFLAAFAIAPLAATAPNQKGQILPAVWRKFADPATEFEVLRLTSPDYSSFLPPPSAHAVSRRGTFLLYGSDLSGTVQVFRLDLKTGASRQLTDLPAVDSQSIAMMPDERSFVCFSGRVLYQVNLSNLREREVYEVPQQFERTSPLALSIDGIHGTFIEAAGGKSYVRLLGVAKASLSTIAEVDGNAYEPQPRPRRASVLYRRNDNEIWLTHYDGTQTRQLPSAPGRVLQAMWSQDGKTILYLNVPDEPKRLNTLRELTPDTNTDRAVAPTSQFVTFAGNGDGSVFVGASGSKASPHVLLLLRVTRREFTLCEHRSSDPSSTEPVFSPGSQRIYFQSDKHGKPAIYSMIVEKLVEKTEQDAEDEAEQDDKGRKKESR